MDDVRSLKREDAPLIGRIIADGFADDAVNLWTFCGTAAMRPAFTAMARHLYLPRGFGHTTADGMAGSLWLPPHAVKSYGIGNLSLAAHILRHGGIRSLKRSLMIDHFMTGARRQRAPHYYLFAIAVNPALQGRGLGGRLMRTALEKIDADRMPAYLENSKEANIGFYRNHGFELLEKAHPAPGCPPLWLMWRPARP